MRYQFTYYVEAEYKDGFILREDEADVSPYDPERNIFHAILNFLPVVEHGPMVRFSLITPVLGHDNLININQQFNVDWTAVPGNARPIRFKKMEADFVNGEQTEKRLMGIGFGYQYTDEDGKNQQELIELG